MTACLCIVCLLVDCASREPKNGEGDAATEQQAKRKDALRSPDELAMLLSMNWQEACNISSQHLEVPPYYRVAADKIEVVKTNSEGGPQRVRATGRVFIDMRLQEPVTVLAQEAFLTEDEAILRGKPLLQRGDSIIEGLHNATVFYFLGPRLKVLGRHRVRHEAASSETIAKAIPAGYRGDDFGDPGPPPVLPILRGPWGSGPNPLLPPLTSDSVPASVRLKMLEEAQAVEVTPLFLPAGGETPPDVEFVGPPEAIGKKAG